MKKILFVMVFLLLISCNTKEYLINGNCNKNSYELIRDISKILNDEGFIIGENDSSRGYLTASTKASYNSQNEFESKEWAFIFEDNEILAVARKCYNKTRILYDHGKIKFDYYNDETIKDCSWYWNVRNALDTLCGTKLEVIKPNLRKKSDRLKYIKFKLL